ncbi:MAG: hypothetical protein ACYTFG_11910, partial [Planctomycetota bacterium]
MIRFVFSVLSLPLLMLSPVLAGEKTDFEVFYGGDSNNWPLPGAAGFSENGDQIFVLCTPPSSEALPPDKKVESQIWIFNRSGQLREKQVLVPGPWEGRLATNRNTVGRLWVQKDELVDEHGGIYLYKDGRWGFKGYLSLPDSGEKEDRVTIIGTVPGKGTLIVQNRKLFLATLEEVKDLGSIYVRGRIEPTPTPMPFGEKPPPAPVNPAAPSSFKVKRLLDGTVLSFHVDWINLEVVGLDENGKRLTFPTPKGIVPVHDIDIRNEGKDIAIVCIEPSLGLWVRRGSVERTIPLPAIPLAVFWMPSGRILVHLTNGTSYLLLADPETGRLSSPMSLPYEVDRICVHRKTGDILGLFRRHDGCFIARESKGILG